MKISIDYQAFTLQTYGGVSRYFTRLAQGFLAAGEQVKLFAPLHINAYVTSLPPDTVQGRKLTHFPPKTKHFFLAYNQFISRGQIARWQPDVVHETYYTRYRTAPVKCPTVVTVYDMIHELFAEQFPRRDNTAAIKKIALSRADHIICISESTKKDLIKMHDIAEDKITVVLLGFDQFTYKDHAARYQPANGKPFLLYVGSRSGYKNFTGFLKAVAASPALKSDFDVLAFGGGKFNVTELALISSLGFAPNQVQQISGDDTLLGSCYAAARAFVYPSLYEGFGIPPLEAMEQGCPVISSNTSSMPEVIGNAGGYFNPTSTDEMQCAMESVVYADHRIAELKQLGRARLEHFSWTKCAEKTRAVYRTLL